jgi:hypothetical protein
MLGAVEDFAENDGLAYFPRIAQQLAENRGGKVWQGELAVEQTLNADVTTAFPIDQAVGERSLERFAIRSIGNHDGLYCNAGARG